MSYKVKFTKLYSNLGEIKFKAKCEFCDMLSENLINNKCNFCNRYLKYVNKVDCILYTFRNLFLEIASKKSFYDYMSWFDFQLLECKLIDIADQNALFQYNPRNLNFYIDLNNATSDDYLKTIYALHEALAGELLMTKSIVNSANDYIKKVLESNAESKENRLFHTNITLNYSKIPSYSFVDREKLYEMFCEKLDFLN